MIRSGFLLISLRVLLVCLAAYPLARPANLFAYSSQELFAQYGESVLQVRIVDRNTGLKAGFGSGFIVSNEGLIATNYHVVADLVMEPDDHRADYVDQDGKRGALSLVALDVVNDLALMRAEESVGEALALSGRKLVQGEAIHALGNPFDLGLTIVDGTYNGFQEKSLYDRIHFTGSINPGMSGGPTLDRFGNVVGINVATAGNQVSFLIPVAKLKVLMRTLADGEQSGDSLENIRRQLLDNQQRYFDELLSGDFPLISLGEYALPGELADYIHCWGHTRTREEALYDLSFQTCSTQDELYLSEDLSTGKISFRHELYRSEDLGRIRFYNLLERQAQHARFGFGGDEEDLTDFSCGTQLLDKGSFSLKTVLCLRRYKHFEGLYDLYFTAFSVHEPQQSLRTSLNLTGVSYVNAREFLSTYLEGVSWQTKP